MTHTPAADIVERRKSSGCPLCGATPHHGLDKVEHCSLHGEPFQRFSIWCPAGHARVTSINESAARKQWEQRPEIEALQGILDKAVKALENISGMGNLLLVLEPDLPRHVASKALASIRGSEGQ